MINEIIVTGKQRFMGLEIPVVFGGFGRDKKCISDKTVAQIHNQPIPEIRRRILENIKRFEIGKDILDLKAVVLNDDEKVMGESHDNLLFELGYTQMQISKAEHIYILSERGYAKLIKIMDTDLAWEVHDKLIDEYFELRDDTVPKIMELIMILETEILGIKNEMSQFTQHISNKIDVGFCIPAKIDLDYLDCIADSQLANSSYKSNIAKAKNIITEIKKYGGFDQESKVFSRIYKLMKLKCGIDIEKCKEDYVFQNPNKSEISPWTVILNSPILYNCFMKIALEILNKLKTYGSCDEYIVSTNFDDAKSQLKLIANDRFDSNKLNAYKSIYKCMSDLYGVDWSLYSSKKDAIKQSITLQDLFIKAVNYIQYNQTV